MTSPETAPPIFRRRLVWPAAVRAGTLLGAAVLVFGLFAATPIAAQTPGGSLLAKAAQKSGKPFKECDECPEMVAIPSGNYWMGRDDGKSVETPAVPVAVLKPFALSRYEVTWDEWLACVEAGPCTHIPSDHHWGRGRQPIMNITWQDAQDYVGFLRARTGQPYRLPVEAEWEYAARAGTDTFFPWGDEAGTYNANCRKCGTPWDGQGNAPVGTFKPNAFGLYDMHGNVWEWTEDCWNPTHDGAPTIARARTDGDCERRVIRSGSWYYIPRLMASTYRDRHPAKLFSYNIGIRVARDLD
ncbi:MAG: formylglycine-generating enzyme family protein [Alphaproteobacteria bacterium]